MTTKLLFITITSLLTVLNINAQYVQKTNLPTIYIETFDGQSITSKEEYKLCRLHYVDEAGSVASYDSVSIRGRGGCQNFSTFYRGTLASVLGRTPNPNSRLKRFISSCF